MLRILFTGGGSGGHIYPLVAVADEFAAMKGVSAQLSYIGPRSQFDGELSDRDIRVFQIASSKIRRYFSVLNFVDVPKFFWSVLQALYRVYRIMPDVVFSKGGPGSLAVVVAAKFYFIPVILHESDAVPGINNKVSGKLANRIAVSFPEAAKFFPKNKVAVTGSPIRAEMLQNHIPREEAKAKLGFRADIPLALVLGGSQGAEQLNDFVVNNIVSFLKFSQVLHQTGAKNFKDVSEAAALVTSGTEPATSRKYRAVDFFAPQAMKDALLAADVVVSRAGSSAIAEIAAFGKPSILVPLENSANGHQMANAISYAASGAAIIFERTNFTYHVVALKIKEIVENRALNEKMSSAAKSFSIAGSAKIIADEIIKLAVYL
ncbi:hypothetical protein A3D55_01245 [Candidatus Jorgensenbacteria bacterium RIFCSPHIGHO2_02_FULL_45_20]|uniref:UDP-N-acetylglucosamine--N-acetylmuramyl-(pentapeptide) pyrophosphoryl-undecaprenol N-acetylglucosamine transferase n=2 Tax=Candidatus Joergenseniibacteriota TaxID=1752739 RepID=A0A1F6BN22_9BACT|nr:MAG: hypothetical protein UX22_C0012G0011 [Candidatus Jorgensenbacteria bacterium GW2011_GWA2_45_9]OGG38325.1 MAG: hypothetical protein A3D55_01245 [Candidatus Jorgensenbacteria bacterium RIFCSPHIGHO2_02_FULL_45_20]